LRLHLSSNDRHVHACCQEVFGEILGTGWTLHIASSSAPECDADLYIWDVEADSFIFSGIEPANRWRHLFLVDRSFVQEFRQSLPFADANIVLKPVTHAALMSFIPEGCKRSSRQPKSIGGGAVESLRADRDDILQCLIQANLKLQEYDQDRTNFLARAIHEFRAPLTAITGYCGLLIGEDLGPLTDDQRDVLERMHRSARKLSRMASAMFQLSIAPRAEVTLDLQKGEIRECMEHALHEILPPAEEKRLSISVDMAPCPEPLYFERMKLEQVLVNLLDNACKFAPRGGSIDIRGYSYYWDRRGNIVEDSTEQRGDSHGAERKRPNSYRIDITDSGPGVPPTHLTKIFEEYTQYAGGVDRSGGGLGLAICRMILNQHKGRIWAESSKQGALFAFVLPFQGSEPVDSSRPKRQHASNF
jgi:signal transduction histidine kinase